VLLIALPLTELPRRAASAARAVAESKIGISPVEIGILVLVLAAFVLLFTRTLRAGAGALPAVPAPTCGIVPAQVAASLLLVPAGLVGWFPSLVVWAGALHPGSSAYQVANAVLVLALALLAARLFCAPRAVVAAWSAAELGADPPVQEGAVRKALSAANSLSLFTLLAIAIVPSLAMAWAGLLGGKALVLLLVLVAVVLDVGTEVRARIRGEELVAVYPLHRVYAVEPVLAALAAAGIAAHVRGRYVRALWHFFAPFVPIEVMVPPGRAAEAEAICARIVQARAAPAGRLH
jgi:hypothetical protein